jgi:hypothetical protein
VSDELERWARRCAPDVIARAEAEAVAVLRDALVRAALGGRDPVAAPAPPRPERAVAAVPLTGDVLWAYGVIDGGERLPDGLTGVAGAAVDRVEAAGLAALVSAVPRAEFDAEPLRRNLKDLAWLEPVARAHERVLDQVLGATTVVPLRLCTLYDDEAGVTRMLEREARALGEALEALGGREEWGVKMLVDPARLADAAADASDEAAGYREEIAGATGGAAYLIGRRLERHVRERASALAADVADEAHAALRERALSAVRHPPQNRELSGHDGDMLLNGAYLIDRSRAGELREVAAELEARHRALGARVEVTGPWPPYNFASTAGIA